MFLFGQQPTPGQRDPCAFRLSVSSFLCSDMQVFYNFDKMGSILPVVIMLMITPNIHYNTRVLNKSQLV